MAIHVRVQRRSLPIESQVSSGVQNLRQRGFDFLASMVGDGQKVGVRVPRSGFAVVSANNEHCQGKTVVSKFIRNRQEWG